MNKQIISKIIVFTFSIFLFASCDNEVVDPVLAAQVAANNSSSGNGGGGVTSGNFTATVDGTNFAASSIIANLTATPIGNTLNIIGLKSTGEYISITIGSPAVGTFTANNSFDPLHPAILSYQQNATSSDIYTANNSSLAPTGSITITAFDSANKTISGTFNFDGYLSSGSGSVKHITNGVFNNVNYVVQ
jgi:uncharacterized lipoprotein YajG